MDLSQKQMRAELKRQVNAAGGLMGFCRTHDMSHPSVSEMIRGVRQVSEAVANACGFISQTVFKKIREVA